MTDDEMYLTACAAWCNVTPEHFAKAHPDMPSGSREGWVRVFRAVEQVTKDAAADHSKGGDAP